MGKRPERMIIYRPNLRDEIKQAGLFGQADKQFWQKEWVVDCEPVGTGEAAFKYLAPFSLVPKFCPSLKSQVTSDAGSVQLRLGAAAS